MGKKKEKPNRIEFRIAEIKHTNFFQADPAELRLEKDDLQNGVININPTIETNIEENSLKISLEIDFSVEKEDRLIRFLGIKTMHKYIIKNLEKFPKVGSASINIPKELMLSFMHTAVASTRGMIAVLNTTPTYSDIILPIIDVTNLIHPKEE